MPAAKATREDGIDVRQAVQAASKFAEKLYPSFQFRSSLEEIEKTEDEKFWLVTLGFEPIQSGIEKSLADMLNPPKERFKVFKVDAGDGTVVSMKIRPLK